MTVVTGTVTGSGRNGLANYEIWLATGDWHGGGEWPPRRTEAIISAEETKESPASPALLGLRQSTHHRARDRLTSWQRGGNVR